MNEHELTKSVDARFKAQELRINRMYSDFEALKLLMEKNNTSLEEFIALAKGFKFGLKILGGIEAAAVWVAKIAAAFGILWAIWKFLIREALAHAFK